MATLRERLEPEAERVARIKAAAGWEEFGGTLGAWGGFVSADADDPGFYAHTATRQFVLTPEGGRLTYMATDTRASVGRRQQQDTEEGTFATVADALALAEAFLVGGRDLRDIDVPRDVAAADLPAPPGGPIPRPKLRRKPPASRWYDWRPPATPRAAWDAVASSFRWLFGGYMGCLTVPIMAVLTPPAAVFVLVLIRGPWGWVLALPLGFLIALVTMVVGGLIVVACIVTFKGPPR